MQPDIQPDEIDWIFCWRTVTGGIVEGSRDSSYNGRSVPYRPETRGVDAGLRTIVRGHSGVWPHEPTGPRLDEQGAISRMCMRVAGYVHGPHLVPARSDRELGVLADVARVAIRSRCATEWALAAIHARGQMHMAIHIGARPAVVADLAGSVAAAWTLDVKERIIGSQVDGGQVTCLDTRGLVTGTLEADTFFDDAAVPAAPAQDRPRPSAHEQHSR